MIFPVDTKDNGAVARFLQESFSKLFGGDGSPWITRVFEDTTALFSDKNPEFGPLSLRYHNFEHTLQATVCLVMILEGRHLAGASPRFTARQFELAVAAMLFHDCGYLKPRSDQQGTGAKYTFIHELRSSAYAASYLPTIGAKLVEVEDVVSAIRCTGPKSQISQIYFTEAQTRVMGCCVATADYIAQMAAPDYPEKLVYLYAEFVESYDFFGIPEEERLFKSLRHMLQNTQSFWSKFVLPRLENDYDGVYRFLAAPGAAGKNFFLEAIAANLAKIKLGTDADR